jgi:hypothetical protein
MRKTGDLPEEDQRVVEEGLFETLGTIKEVITRSRRSNTGSRN